MTIRLILGDCIKTMGFLAAEGTTIHHIITDPPYEDHMHRAKASHANRRRHRTDGARELASLKFDCIDSIRKPVLVTSKKLCTGWFIAFCTPEGVAAWRDGLEREGAKYKRACVWVKPDAAPQFNGQGPAMGAEMVVTAWMGKGYSQWNGGGRRGVFEHLCNPPDRMKNPGGGASHPTEKPLSLMLELVSLFTQPGETVLDPFMGIGSTGVACVKLGRNFIGIERDEKYFSLAKQRIELAARQPDFFHKTPQPDAWGHPSGDLLSPSKGVSHV